jgi:hypothetical protein
MQWYVSKYCAMVIMFTTRAFTLSMMVCSLLLIETVNPLHLLCDLLQHKLCIPYCHIEILLQSVFRELGNFIDGE